jgi:hypothetical protein
MSTKYFVWIVHVPICLWEIFLGFLDFSEYFSCFKTFSKNFLELFSHLNYFWKIIKKSKSIFLAQQPKSGYAPLTPLAWHVSPFFSPSYRRYKQPTSLLWPNTGSLELLLRLFLSVWAEPEGPTRSALAQPRAHTGPI